MDIGNIASNSAQQAYGTDQVQKASPKPDLADMVERLIEAKDQDGTGALSMDELGISEEAFGRLDANQDNQLDSEELLNGLEQLRRKMGPPSVMGIIKGLGSDDEENEEPTLLDLLAQDDDETTLDGLNISA